MQCNYRTTAANLGQLKTKSIKIDVMY
jgi:hypothetical protein